MIFTLLRKVPLWAYAMLVLAALTGFSQYQRYAAVRELKDYRAEIVKERLNASENNRETERMLARARTNVADNLAAARQATVALARTSDERLRAVASQWAASAASGTAGASCRYDGAPIVAVLRDEDRAAFVALGEEAQRNAERLAAAQDYIRTLKCSK